MVTILFSLQHGSEKVHLDRSIFCRSPKEEQVGVSGGFRLSKSRSALSLSKRKKNLGNCRQGNKHRRRLLVFISFQKHEAQIYVEGNGLGVCVQIHSETAYGFG